MFGCFIEIAANTISNESGYGDVHRFWAIMTFGNHNRDKRLRVHWIGKMSGHMAVGHWLLLVCAANLSFISQKNCIRLTSQHIGRFDKCYALSSITANDLRIWYCEICFQFFNRCEWHSKHVYIVQRSALAINGQTGHDAKLHNNCFAHKVRNNQCIINTQFHKFLRGGWCWSVVFVAHSLTDNY